MHYKVFKKKYQELKESEKWQEIIELCYKAFKNTKLSQDQRSEIYAILATINYYMGQYQKALCYAKKESDCAQNINVKAYAYSLVFTCYCTLFSKDPSNELHANNIKTWIKKTLALTNDNSLKDIWRAKIYFNAGVVYQDIFYDYKKAEEYYKKVIEIDNIGSDAYIRTTIRMIRAVLDGGNAAKAFSSFNTLYSNIITEGITEQTAVHLMILKSRLFISQGSYLNAQYTLDHALSKAQEKGMADDAKRIQAVINSISIDVKICLLNTSSGNSCSMFSSASNIPIPVSDIQFRNNGEILVDKIVQLKTCTLSFNNLSTCL